MNTNAPAVDDLGLLQHLADRNGVATTFWDWYGNQCNVGSRSLLAVLEALGVPVTADATIKDVHDALAWTEDQFWLQTLPDCTVVRKGATKEIPVHVPHGSWVHLDYSLEEGGKGELHQLDRWVEPRVVNDVLTGRATFEIPSHLPLGWHTLTATVEGGAIYTAPLIVVPNRVSPPVLHQGRHWGVAAQMYSARSASSWGLGDAEDLANLAAVCGQKGADFLLINPVHAAATVAPMENSPYLPVTRRWVNPIYARPEAITEYVHAPESMRVAIEELRESAASENGAPIERDRTWAAKSKALELVFTLPRSYHRQAEFEAFVAQGGQDLANFALWCALVEKEGSLLLPEKYANADMPAIEAQRAALADRVEFWQWCQWVTREQLVKAHEVARTVGMKMGIMADLAVGVHANGSEIWSEPGVFAPGMQVGAPPDMYSQQGQNWAQPPWSPRALARTGYRPLRDMLRAVLAHAGAIRIDHILGLFRLWWIPAGRPASEGTYVYFDHEAMVGVVLLEAQRAGAVVIGEDLGTVEPWVRDYLADRGILGTSVVWFEKEDSGWPLHAGHYRWGALSTVNTHDLPPTAGYLVGVQTELRNELGLLVEDIESVRAADRRELEQMMVRLREYGFLEAQSPTIDEVIVALHRYAAATPSALVGVSLVDVVGDVRPQNLPGTSAEYPNWCVPLCDGDGKEIYIEDLATNARAAAIFEAVDSSVH